MSIEAQLQDDYKDAMRAKDTNRVACIRQLKSKMQETVNAEGFDGAVDDTLYQQVIGSYVKSLQKGIAELEAAGDRGAELRGRYQAEIDYLSGFLPKKLDEAKTLELVEQTIAALGVSDPKQTGRVMGAIMKEHKDSVDAGLVKRLVSQVLAG